MIHIAQYDGVGNKITNSSIKSNKIKESATTCKSKILTITDIMKRTRKRMGDPYFFNWDMNKNNCQYFVIHILKSLKIYRRQ